MGPDRPILLILDLDETLVHATEEPLGREHDFIVGPAPSTGVRIWKGSWSPARTASAWRSGPRPVTTVYQAYNPETGHFAARNGDFGGGFGMGRMSWIKPNFLWMMYRSGWGTKLNQEVTLAVRLKRAAFDEILRQAVHSSFEPEVYKTHQEWKNPVAGSDVRLQWDPDHAPAGNPVERRAIQLGLRGEVLSNYAREWLLGIEDISEFVAEQRANAAAPYERLVTPSEDIYPVADSEIARRLRVSQGIPGAGETDA
jgi:hypothetical protein